MSSQVSRIEDVYPLTPMQQGMLFHALHDSDNEVFFEQLSATIEGPLNLVAFRQTWERIVERHAVFRTGFNWHGNELLQIVYKRAPLSWEEHDWSTLSESDQNNRLAEFLLADRHRGFDLSQPPLMRLIILRFSEKTHRFIWSHHHILLDGWSSNLLQQEVLTTYRGIASGHDVELPRPRPYREYIAWLANRDTSEEAEFWRRWLTGFTEPTPLPFDHSHNTESADGGYGVKRVTLSESATAALERFARAHKLTVNTIIQGAWAILIGRYGDTEDVVFGEVVSGRPAELAGVTSMVGLFINSLPVRVQIKPHHTVKLWFEKLQGLALEVLRHQFSPLTQIQTWSEIPKGTPLFESLIVFENFSRRSSSSQAISDLNTRDVRSFSKTNYPLTLVVASDRELRLLIAYDGKRFRAATIARVTRYLCRLLEAIPASGEKRISELPFQTDAELQEIAGWNETSEKMPEAAIHKLFEDQVRRTPDALAVIDERNALTYRELDCRANQVADMLRRRGVRQEAVVAVYVESGAATLATLLGILKAGAAYLPLDGDNPRERIETMISESGSGWLIAEHGIGADWLAEKGAVIWVDSKELDSPTTGERWEGVSGSQLAYVIYTSGSTGKPKGVMVSHQALVNRSVALGKRYSLGPGQRVLRFVSLSLDASAEEIFPTLIRGATVVWQKSSNRMEPLKLIKFSEQQSVTVMHLPTVYWAQLVEECSQAGRKLPESVELTIVGGESPRWEQIREWRECNGTRSRLVQAYGPTETTITATIYEVECEADEREATRGRVPIGRPVANTEVYVLNRRLELQPVGMRGEVYVGGESLARGYVNHPEWTAERFVPDPFSGRSGARLFRSGDEGRWRADGQLEFLGRRDQQVKVRGYRVELEEIEAVIAQHPAVKECCVTARENGDERELTVWTVPSGAVEPDAEVRDFLQSKLPPWMIPSDFVSIDCLPRNSLGKVDRRALSNRIKVRPLTSSKLESVRNPVEELIVEIWADVLKVEPSLQDNFFALGGNSLSAIRMVAKLRRAFQIDLPVTRIFDTPILKSLAAHIQATISKGSGWFDDSSISPGSRSEYLPLSLTQERLWLLDLALPGSHFFNMSFTAHLAGPLSEANLKRSLNEVVGRHESLRTQFRLVGEDVTQVIVPVIEAPFVVVDLRQMSASVRDAETRKILNDLVKLSFVLAEDVLIRATLIRIGEQERILLLVVHHIVADGWSMNLLLSELAERYNAYTSGSPLILAPQPITYADYAQWQRNWMQGDGPRLQLNYWKQKLSRKLEPLQLQQVRQEAADAAWHISTESLTLNSPLSTALNLLSRAECVTLFMTLLAAFKVVLFRYSTNGDVRVGTLSANRRDNTEGLIGLFLNTLILRTDLSGNPDFKQLLRAVRETCLGAFTNQDLPFDALMLALKEEENLRKSDAFQVMFIFQPKSSRTLDLHQVTVRRLSPSGGAHETGLMLSSADLVLVIREHVESLTVDLRYKTRLFSVGTVAALLRDFQRVLERVTDFPNTRLLELVDAETH